ncbi:MAG: hypothetical protein ACP5O1_11470 [Phycisphaerae bacterium]
MFFNSRARQWAITGAAAACLAACGTAAAGSQAHLWSPASSGERLLQAASKEASTIRVVYRYSWRGHPAEVCRVASDLRAPWKFACQMVAPMGKLRLPAPPIYWTVGNGTRTWWATPLVPASGQPRNGAWFVSFWPRGAPVGLPVNSTRQLGFGYIRAAMTPWSVSHELELLRFSRRAGDQLTVISRPAKYPHQVYRIYTASVGGKLLGRVVMRLRMGRSVRLYSTRVWKRGSGGRMVMLHHQWTEGFHRVDGVWIPTEIYDQRTDGSGQGKLAPATSVRILRASINPAFRPGYFVFRATQGSAVFTYGPNQFTFVHYRLRAGRATAPSMPPSTRRKTR